MCFVFDADWYAEVQQEDAGPAEKAFGCDECGRGFPVGAWRREVSQRQYELCRTCEEEGNEGECLHDPPNYGETFGYEACEECTRLRAAIRDVEAERGCPPVESEPPLPMLYENLGEIDREDRAAYLARAREMYPEHAGRWDDLAERYLEE